MRELKATTAQEIVREEKDCDYMDELFGGVKIPPTQVYLKSDVDAAIAELKAENERLKERSQWHRQKEKDIYFECGKHWGAEYIIKMKDGTTHLAYGGCDEGGDGSVSTYLHLDDDYEWEFDDIDIWYEIPDPKVIGNIMEADK